MVTTDDDHDDKRSNISTSSEQRTPIDNRIKDDLRNNIDLSVLSNVSKQKSSSFDDINGIPPLTFRSTESLPIAITDEQKTFLTMSKKYSRPKILIEDVQCK